MDSSLRSSHCFGKADGEDCLCRRFTQIPTQDPDQPALCRDCRHPEGYHPLPTSSIAGIVSAYKDASRIPSLKTSTSLKASMSTAKQESNSGLKRKHAGDENKLRPNKKTKHQNAEASGSGHHADDKVYEMGQVIFLPQGLPHRNRTSQAGIAPRDNIIANMEQWGLAVNGLRSSLSFQQRWDSHQLDAWFRSLFPQVYAYLDKFYPLSPGSLHWRLLIKTHNHLSVSPVPCPDATDAAQYLGNSGKRNADRKLHIISTHAIPFSIYSNDWDHDLDPQFGSGHHSVSESDTYSTVDSDSSKDIAAFKEAPSKVRTKRRKGSVQAGKQKAVSTKALSPINVNSDSEYLPISVTVGAQPAPAPVTILTDQVPSTVAQPHPSIPSPISSPSASPAPLPIALAPLTSTLPVASAVPGPGPTLRQRHTYAQDTFLTFSDGLETPEVDPWAIGYTGLKH